MEFSRSEYWSGYPFPSPGYLPNPRIKPRSPALQEDSLPAEPQGKPTREVTPVNCLSKGKWGDRALREASRARDSPKCPPTFHSWTIAILKLLADTPNSTPFLNPRNFPSRDGKFLDHRDTSVFDHIPWALTNFILTYDQNH